MPAYLLLEMGSRYANGYWFQVSDASAALASYRSQYPQGRWRLFEIRDESDRPLLESLLPSCAVENARLVASFGTDGGR